MSEEQSCCLTKLGPRKSCLSSDKIASLQSSRVIRLGGTRFRSGHPEVGSSGQPLARAHCRTVTSSLLSAFDRACSRPTCRHYRACTAALAGPIPPVLHPAVGQPRTRAHCRADRCPCWAAAHSNRRGRAGLVALPVGPWSGCALASSSRRMRLRNDRLRLKTGSSGSSASIASSSLPTSSRSSAP